MAKYKVDSSQAYRGFLVSNPDIGVRESWLFEVDLLELGAEVEGVFSPAKVYLEYFKENYSDVKVFRNYYVETETKQFGEPCGFNIVFPDKKQAEAYAEELNSRIV